MNKKINNMNKLVNQIRIAAISIVLPLWVIAMVELVTQA